MASVSVAFAPDLSPSQEALRWAEEYERADRELNATYQKVLAAHDSKSGKKLREAQRRWVAFRDAEQAFIEQKWEGGSGRAAAVNQTLTFLTRDRTRQLKNQLN